MNTLTFQTHLNTNIIQLNEAGSFIGKDVIVSIIELPALPQVKKLRKWNYLGAVQLDKQLDNRNIRDVAYE